MTRIFVLYYSAYGHIETMAPAIAEGAGQAGAEVVVKRGPQLVPQEVARTAGYELDQMGPIDGRRTGRLRRDHPRHAHPLRSLALLR